MVPVSFTELTQGDRITFLISILVEANILPATGFETAALLTFLETEQGQKIWFQFIKQNTTTTLCSKNELGTILSGMATSLKRKLSKGLSFPVEGKGSTVAFSFDDAQAQRYIEEAFRTSALRRDRLYVSVDRAAWKQKWMPPTSGALFSFFFSMNIIFFNFGCSQHHP